MISKKILILGSKNIYHIVEEFSVGVFHGLRSFFLIKWPFNGENMENIQLQHSVAEVRVRSC